MVKETQVHWLTKPEEHDSPAAASYLSLLFDEQTVEKYVEQLRQAPITTFKAKDIFRASGLSLLGVSNSHVEHDRKKILAGQTLSPLLLVRDPDSCKVSLRTATIGCAPFIRLMKTP